MFIQICKVNMNNNELLDYLKAELNSISSNEITIEECSKITLSLWKKSKQNYKSCISVINNLKSRSNNVSYFKKYSQSFLSKLSEKKDLSLDIDKKKIKKTNEINFFNNSFLQIKKQIANFSTIQKIFGISIPLFTVITFYVLPQDIYLNCEKNEWKIARSYIAPNTLYYLGSKNKQESSINRKRIKLKTITKNNKVIGLLKSTSKCSPQCLISFEFDFLDIEKVNKDLKYVNVRAYFQNKCKRGKNCETIEAGWGGINDQCLIVEEPII